MVQPGLARGVLWYMGAIGFGATDFVSDTGGEPSILLSHVSGMPKPGPSIRKVVQLRVPNTCVKEIN